MALSFAVAAGASVYVTSGDPSKIQKAVKLGAKGGANYKETYWPAQLQDLSGGFDVIIDSAGGPGFKYLTRARPTLVPELSLFGRTAGNIEDLQSAGNLLETTITSVVPPWVPVRNLNKC